MGAVFTHSFEYGKAAHSLPIVWSYHFDLEPSDLKTGTRDTRVMGSIPVNFGIF